MIQAAGILYVTPDGRALFLKRGPGSDHPGEWAFPGGHVEDGETHLEAAKRESLEEIGETPEGEQKLWTRSVAQASAAVPVVPGQGLNASSDVDFTTYRQFVEKPFEPVLSDEHVGWAWAPITQPPQPVHPGAQVALDKFAWDELGVARAIRDGVLTSPQEYENIFLFKIRVTGTGTAYRPKLNEYVYRRPENYLTDDFVARCNGLPVIIEHPATDVLNTSEFTRRIIGTVMLPFIEEDEVWAIAKIYDMPAAKVMAEKQLSTSPAVVFRGANTNIRLEMEDGKTLLVEGPPTLLDHLAVCEVGVWDKGGDPVGVVSAEIKGDSAMTEKNNADDKSRMDSEEAARSDAAMLGEKLDKFLSHVDSIHSKLDSVSSRMDSFEEKMKEAKGDSEEKEEKKTDAAECEKCGGSHAADAKCDAKKDSEEPEEEEGEAKRVVADKRKDSSEEEKSKKDSKKDEGETMMDSATKDDIRRLESMIARPMSDADHREMAGLQAKADRVFEAFGDSAPRPLQGESKINYRIRLAGMLQKHSKVFANSGLDRIAMADSAGFEAIEEQIYKDAMLVAQSPSTVPEGTLRMVRRDDGYGHIINEFIGKPSAWMSAFMPERQYVVGRFDTSSIGSK